MYDYAAGKVEWMAFNLPVEGEKGPFVGSALVDVPTCCPSDRPDEVLERVGGEGGDRIVVVNEDRVVLGTVSAKALRDQPTEASLLDVLEASPSTIRPSVEIAELNEKAAGVLVTTPDGVLLGAVDPVVAEQAGES